MAGNDVGASGSSLGPAKRFDDPRRRLLAVLALAVLALVVLLLLLSRSDDGDGPLARLEVIDDAVAVQPRATAGFGPARTGRTLALGDTLRTDPRGRGQVNYAEGSLTRLDRDTTLVVEKLAVSDRPDPIGVRIDVGRTWHEVADITTTGERFQATTSNAVATVRGTVFTVDCTPQQVCTFAVEEGVVEVVTRTGERITLRAGESVTVGPDGRLGSLLRISFQELARVDEWIRFNLGLRGPLATTTTATTTTTPAAPTSTSSTTTTTSTEPPAGTPTTTAGSPATIPPPAGVPSSPPTATTLQPTGPTALVPPGPTTPEPVPPATAFFPETTEPSPTEPPATDPPATEPPATTTTIPATTTTTTSTLPPTGTTTSTTEPPTDTTPPPTDTTLAPTTSTLPPTSPTSTTTMSTTTTIARTTTTTRPPTVPTTTTTTRVRPGGP